MTGKYSSEVCKKLEAVFRAKGVHRPMRVERYEPDDELVYEVRGVADANIATIRLTVEKFVGGGFAGQVYRVKLLEMKTPNGPISGLKAGGVYAMKILVPPSRFSQLFRNALYWIGFQGPFLLQVNPTAARAGALWQKFFRRGAAIRFGDAAAVADIHATFVDSTLGSCGELSEWIDGRTWRLEVDENLDSLKRWRSGKPVAKDRLGSPEYRAKYRFMHEFVNLLHDMGGHEFARQYEWSTCKSQPNCLKRINTEDDPAKGLVAVDFRAGLALLPFLPMSPGDFGLIFKGIARGSWVQFDRGDVEQLQRFVDAHRSDFKDMHAMLDDLKACERVYRDSVPDVTHHHFRLFYSRRLWATLLDSAVTSWKVRNRVDDRWARKLGRSRKLTLLFGFIGWIPFLGASIQRVTGHALWRRHYQMMVTRRDYLRRAFQAKMAEKVLGWHRSGRVNDQRALTVASASWRFAGHSFLSLLPVGLHRFISDRRYAKERLDYLFVRPVRLYFNPDVREQWLRDMVKEGREKNILTTEDSEIILNRIKEPFIQKYLKSLAVHVCTLPVTQVVSVLLAMGYIMMHPEMPRAQAWGIGIGIIALFQVVPISPGSLVRGLYVVYLVIKERNFKDYNIAVFLGFFKYVGYLAFPIQMAYRYPVLARFMAGHWANESVHIVPVFGESGALLEHWVFCLFYNWPLTIRRRVLKRLETRAALPKRFWHIGLCVILAAGMFGLTEYVFFKQVGQVPGLKDIGWFCVLVSLICGAAVTMGCGGASVWERIAGAVVWGCVTAGFYTTLSATLVISNRVSVAAMAADSIWRMFIFSIFAVIGVIITELKLTDPDLKKSGHPQI